MIAPRQSPAPVTGIHEPGNMRIGIIAGAGDLPLIVARDARERGFVVVTAALEQIASPELTGCSDELAWVNVGKLGDLIDTLKRGRVNRAIMVGKVSKSLIYKSVTVPDLRAMKLLFSLKDRGDDVILRALAAEFEKEGIHVVDTTSFSPHLLTPDGVMTKRAPTKEEWSDIEYGSRIAREIGRLDIGQTVVIKDRAVTAVEAIEGTDEAILRGGRWAGKGAVVIKMSKPQQDMKLDVPAVGLSTIGMMIEVSAGVLALEAARSIMIDRQRMIDRADEAGICLVGISHDRSGQH